MTEQVNTELNDAFDLAFADSQDSAADQPKEFTAESVNDQTDESAANQDAQPEAQQDEQQDPWQAVPEALRDQHMQLQQKYQTLETDHHANAVRVAALNRKTIELQQAIQARENQQGGAKATEGIPTADDLEGKTFEQVEAEWPEVAALIKSQVSSISKQFEQRLEQQLAPVQELISERKSSAEAAEVQQQFTLLAEQHPDFKEIAVDPAFAQWVQTQGTAVQQMYASTSAQDNAALLTLFKASTGRLSQAQSTERKTPDDLADHAATPRKGSGQPTATRRESASLLDEFDFQIRNSK